MSNETKIGILAIVAIGLVLWGYTFIKGQNLFSSSLVIYAEYEAVDQLGRSAPIYINGFRVGNVTDVYLNPKTLQSVIVEMDIKEKLPIPKNTVAEIVSSGLLGDKIINLKFSAPCGGSDCVESGDYIQGVVKGLLASMVGEPEDLQQYVNVITAGLNTVLDTVGKRAQGEINTIQATLNNLRTTSEELNRLVAVRANRILADVEVLTKSVSSKSGQIERIISNVDSLTTELAQLQLNQRLDETFANTNTAMASLNSTVASADSAVTALYGVLNEVNSGQGTLGKLVKDEQLYNNLQRSTTNLDLLLQDFRLNPKRYVNVSVFGGGKKEKAYKVPEDDPAFPNGNQTIREDDDN